MAIEEIGVFMYVLLVFVACWDSVWKIIGLWHSARNKKLGWFICIAIFNTLGILPLIYMAFFEKKEIKIVKKEVKPKRVVSKKK